MALRYEIDTVTSSLNDIASRITAIVEAGHDLPGDIYVEIVAAERTIGTLIRRLERVGSRLT